MPDPLAIQVYTALGTLAQSLTGDRVPSSRVYLRSVGEFVPERDKTPSILVYQTPGQPIAQRKTLNGRRETTYPVLVALVDSQDGNPVLSDPKQTSAPHWRVSWRDSFLAAVHGKPGSFPSEVLRVVPSDEVLIDPAQFEIRNLWWSAVPVTVRTRVN